jgi:hypothetical protein
MLQRLKPSSNIKFGTQMVEACNGWITASRFLHCRKEALVYFVIRPDNSCSVLQN